jgi:hypothetical protein
MCRSGKYIIKDVAASTGNDHYMVILPEIEYLSVYGRVFPTGVVYQRAGVN